MKKIIYISGITGGLLLICWLIGLFVELPKNNIILVLALILIGLVSLPLFFIDKYRQNNKINGIIDGYKNQKKSTQQIKNGRSPVKGWSMNNSPFRERKSGLTWGGGNIHASVATRKTRKSFLRKNR
ncbi:MAG: hypothetical protein AMS27_02090 [Bacteroides sp. SM23_62_1]|nr:MAG: hypothetical protein AMS27_02090 [Bacteroides sp. SM23_62_1]